MTPLDKYDITELLATKTYEALSEDERQFVLDELGSEQEYREMYIVVNGIQQLDDAVPTPTLRSNVMDAFDAEHGEDKKVIPLFARRKTKIIGLLAAAAVITAVFIVGVGQLSEHNNELAEAKTAKEMKPKDSTKTVEPTTPAKETGAETDQTVNEDLSPKELESAALNSIVEEPTPAEVVIADMAEDEPEETAKMDIANNIEADDMAALEVTTEEEVSFDDESKDAVAYTTSAAPKIQQESIEEGVSARGVNLSAMRTKSSKKADNMESTIAFSLKMALPESGHYIAY